MKKAILIGKFGKFTGEVGNHLSSLCQVQFCPGNEKILVDILNMATPDLFIVIFQGVPCKPVDLLASLFSKCPNTPLIAVGKSQEESELSEKGYLSRNNVSFLRRPVEMGEIERCAEEMLKPAGADGKAVEEEKLPVQEQPTILLVDDSPQQLYTMQTVLSPRYKVKFATSGTKAVEMAEENSPDLILLDVNMPEMDGFQTLEAIRGLRNCETVPVIFLTANSDAATEIRCLSAGAADFILKPVIAQVLLKRVERTLQIVRYQKHLEQLVAEKIAELNRIEGIVARDAMTGFLHKTAIQQAVDEALHIDQDGLYAFFIFDIDHFKDANDTFGHAFGDKVICQVANTVRANFRSGDLLGRIGGDEFVAFLKVPEEGKATEKASRLNQALSQDFVDGQKSWHMSVSIGIAFAPHDGKTFMELYRCADSALYLTKRGGRDGFSVVQREKA